MVYCRRSKFYVITSILVFIFVCPALFAFLLLQNNIIKNPFTTNNHGEIISMFLPMTTLHMKSYDGKKFSLQRYDEKWSLLYLNDFSCDSHCESNLTNMKQLQKVMLERGKHLELLWVKTTEPTKKDIEVSINKFNIPIAKAETAISESKNNHFYVADPSKNIILSYPDNAAFTDILDDMKRLW